MKESEEKYHNRICGKLLGDGCITKQVNRKPRLQFMHWTTDYDWTNECYQKLKDFLPLTPPTYRKVIDKRLKKGYSESFIVQSKTDATITVLYKIWYPFAKKQIPRDYVSQFLDEEALAWWYQDDGHLKIVNGRMSKIILSTDSFSIEENQFLQQLLRKRFQLHFSLDRQNRLVIYDLFQIIYFLYIISPWLHPSMNRKAFVLPPLREVSKRTTIYLPSTIKLIKPTKEINEKLHNLPSLLKDDKTIDIPVIFNTFRHISATVPNVKAYQIVIEDTHRHRLSSIRQQTGLTVSKLVEYCFK